MARWGLLFSLFATAHCRKPVSVEPLRHVVADPEPAREPVDVATDRPVIAAIAATVLSPSRWVEVAPGLRGFHTRVRYADGVEADMTVLRVELSRVEWTAFAVPTSRLERTEMTGLLAVFNAGFFNHDMQPSGVLEANHTVFGQGMPNGGSGIFFIDQQRAQIVGSTERQSVWAAKELAVQCGPRLIESDGRVGIYSDRGDRYARTALCLRERGTVVDVVETYVAGDTLAGPGLFAFAQALAATSPMGDVSGCESAMNLDGGPSTGMTVALQTQFSRRSIGPIPFAIGLRARAH